jgi:hypothetical protein
MYDRKGNYEQAVLDWTRSIELFPIWTNQYIAETYCKRAQAYYYMQKYDEAWADVHKTIHYKGKVDAEFMGKLKKASGRDEEFRLEI